jgi:hypothetical protein
VAGFFIFLVVDLFGNRIEASITPGVASPYALQAEPRTFENTKLGKCVNSVFRTGGLKAAGVGKNGRN